MKWQLEEQTGSQDPSIIVACVGGGSNAAGAYYHYLENENVRLVAVEAAGLGIDSGESAATSVLGTKGIIHGSRTLLMQTDDGQIVEPYSISAGLDYPGIGPLHEHLIVSGRAEAISITDDAALQAAFVVSRRVGLIPAWDSAHAFAAMHYLQFLPEDVLVINLSGRGDKDLSTYIKKLES
jgi:tryptophan synthase beta chain